MIVRIVKSINNQTILKKKTTERKNYTKQFLSNLKSELVIHKQNILQLICKNITSHLVKYERLFCINDAQ